MTRLKVSGRVLAAGTVLFAACLSPAILGAEQPPATSKPAAALPKGLPANLFFPEGPAWAMDVSGARAAAKPGEPITVRGRIGGPKAPLEPGTASFQIVDLALPYLKTGDDGSARAEPWAYPDQPTATVQVVSASARAVPVSLNGIGGLVPGAEVTIVGTVARADGKAGPLINATGLFVKDGPFSLKDGFFLAEPPRDPVELMQAKSKAKAGEPVVIRGRIGGTVEPFVSGRAMFTLVDFALPTCADKADDHCSTPWDYCCEKRSDIVAHSGTIQVQTPEDRGGGLLRAGLKGVHGLKPMGEVIVVGTVAQRDDKGSFVINATQMYVKP